MEAGGPSHRFMPIIWLLRGGKGSESDREKNPVGMVRDRRGPCTCDSAALYPGLPPAAVREP